MADNDAPVDVADDAASEVPEPVVTPEPERHEEHHEHHDGKPEWVDEMTEKIIGAVNTLKEASPITPVEEKILDETPVRKPWTHRGFGH